jgi:hypothetical protein
MRRRICIAVFALLLMSLLVLPAVASASIEAPDLVASISGDGDVSAGNPQLSGRFGVSWQNVGNAAATGTTTVTVNLPASMTTEGAMFEATCSPVSFEHGSNCESTSQAISPDHHTLTFTFHGTTPAGTGRPLTVLYKPGITFAALPSGTITASVSNSADVNPANNHACREIDTPSGVQSDAPQGCWVGSYGHEGYDLAGWDGTSDVSDLSSDTFYGPSLSVLQGSRWVWASSTEDPRALESPDQSTRDAATYYDSNEIKLRLSFARAYTGNLHLYAVDWDSLGRRETITVGGHTASLSSDFSQGAWVTLPISVAAGGSVPIVVLRTAGANAVLSGVFLGDAGGLPTIGSKGASAQQGSWVGAYGSAGYDLGAWSGSSDLMSTPNATVSLAQGSRWTWSSSTSDLRALQSPDKSTREAATYYDPNQLRLTLTFHTAYTGSLHLYALDWDSAARRELISVGGQTAALAEDFSQGAWVTFPISAAAGETVPIVVDHTAGANAVLSGVFLG